MTPEEKARFREQIAAIPAAPGASVSRCAHCGREVEEKIDPDMGGNHHRWWVHVPGGYTPCNPQQGARSTKAEPAPVGGLRERIREAAAEVWRDGLGGITEADVLDRYADALLPVVEAELARPYPSITGYLDECHAQIIKLTKDRDRLRSELANRDQRIAEARRLLAEAEQQAAQVEANAAHNAAVFHDVSTDRDRLAAEAKRFDKQWDRLAGDRDRLASQVVSLQDELFRAQSALQSHGAGLVEAEAELGTTSRARDSWYRKAQELRKRAEDAGADRARLAAEVAELRGQRDELLNELDGRDEEARERWIQKQLDETGLKAMDFRNGMAMEIEPARELVAHWVGAARAMLGNAENYSETPIEMEVKVGESPERFAFVLQRVGKLTPHQARQKAEAKVAAMLAECDRIEAEVYGQHDEDDDGKREAVRRIRAAAGITVAEPEPDRRCSAALDGTGEAS